MKKIAIITGASSGMGELFAKTIKNHVEFDELWVISRNLTKLQQLQKELDFPVNPISLDLSKTESYDKYKQLLDQEKPQITLLINGSGFGKFEKTTNISLEDNLNMIDLNCKGVVALCYLSIPYMTKGSKILNIASIAAFQPIPYINTYAASKVFVLNFSLALNKELKKEGISVLALCPYWTKTKFFDRAIDDKENPVIKKYVAMYKPEDIVKRAWRGLKHNKTIIVFGFITKMQLYITTPLHPNIIMNLWMKQQKLK